MPLTGVSTVTVTGSFRRPDGSAATGKVRFTPSARLVTSNDDIVVPYETIATLDGSGDISLSLAATDDADVSPSGWSWQVDELIDGVRRHYSILLPAAVTPVDLADIAPVDPVVTNAVWQQADGTSVAAVHIADPTAAHAASAISYGGYDGAGTDDDNSATDVEAALDNLASAKIAKVVLDAQTVLGATADNTPVAFPISASRLFGRKATGDVGQLTAAEAKAILAITDADVSGLAEFIRDTIAAALTAGSNITITPNDVSDIITIAASSGGTSAIVAHPTNSANLTIATATTTALTFNTEVIDTDTMHSTVSNTDRLTCTTAGKYLVIANPNWVETQVTPSGARRFFIRRNGATDIADSGDRRPDPDVTGIDGPQHSLFAIWDMAAGDYFSLHAYQASGGNLDVGGTSRAPGWPFFAAIRVGS